MHKRQVKFILMKMKICRACMAETISNLKPLTATNEIFRLFKEFNAPQNVDLGDGLPKWLCRKCIAILKKFKDFKRQCTKSSEELKLRVTSKNDEQRPDILTVFLDPEDCKLEDFNTGSGDVNGIEDCDADNKSSNSSSSSDEAEMKGPQDEDDEDEKVRKEQIKKVMFVKIRKKRIFDVKNSVKTEYQKKTTYSYQCNECGRGFHYRERYEGHLREHEGKSAAVCEFCNVEYTAWSGLQKHVALMHQDQMKFVCDKCDKKFIYESGLIAHRSRHFGPRRHVCETCGRSFQDTYTLGKHKLSHTDETPFECNVCGKKFKSDPHLKAHQFRHLGIKKFACSLCAKSFTTRPELKQHMRVHSNVKEFQCSTCQQYFRQKSQLSVHQRSHIFD